MRVHQVVVGAAVTFSTWLLAGVAAALLNVPNFDAKRVGQECACALTPYLGGLDLHIELAGLLLSVWIFVPAVVFTLLSLVVVVRKPSWIMSKRSYAKELRRAAGLGLVVGGVAVGVVLAEATLTNSFIVYPSSNQQTLLAAKNFDMILTNGTRIDLYSFKGKPTLLEFMWTKCAHCVKQTEVLQVVHREFGDRINMVSVAVEWGRDDVQALRSFDGKQEVTWLSALDVGGGTGKFGASEVPRLLILDKDCNIMSDQVGEVSAANLISEISNVLSAG